MDATVLRKRLRFCETILKTPGQRDLPTPKSFGRVAVIMGGSSPERAVSLESGRGILSALREQGIEAFPIDPHDGGLLQLQTGHFDRAFIALHGIGGEDGLIQGFLDSLQIPYTGSGVLSSALCMDKVRAKLLLSALNIPTPEFAVADTLETAKQMAQAIGYPVTLKPVFQGSSIAVHHIESETALPDAFAHAIQYGQVMLERHIKGEEFTVSLLNGCCLPTIKISTPRPFYDYQAKYHSHETIYECPCALAPEMEARLVDLSQLAYEALGCRHYARVDYMRDAKGDFWLLEMNTLPGFTTTSLLPKAAKAFGISFEQLVMEILSMTLSERAPKAKIVEKNVV